MAPRQSVKDFLTAYVVGAELEGLLGSLVNPEHKWQGGIPQEPWALWAAPAP